MSKKYPSLRVPPDVKAVVTNLLKKENAFQVELPTGEKVSFKNEAHFIRYAVYSTLLDLHLIEQTVLIRGLAE